MQKANNVNINILSKRKWINSQHAIYRNYKSTNGSKQESIQATWKITDNIWKPKQLKKKEKEQLCSCLKDVLLSQSSLSITEKIGMTLQNDEVHAATTVEQAMTSTTNGRTFIDWQRGELQSCLQTGENSGRTVVYSAFYPRRRACTSNTFSDKVSWNKTKNYCPNCLPFLIAWTLSSPN